MKKIKIFWVLSLMSNLAIGQSLDWVRTCGSTTGLESAFSVNVVGSRVAVAGRFESSVDFNNAGSPPYVLNSFGGSDGFISLYNVIGSHSWTRQIGGSDVDRLTKVICHTDGYIYAIGSFRGTCDFDPDTGVVNYSSFGPWDDTFLLKLDGNGNFVWVKTFGGLNTDFIQDFTIDSIGNIYLFGNYNVSIDLDPGPGIVSYTSLGPSGPSSSGDCFLVKLDLNGNYQNSLVFGSNHEEYATSIIVRDNQLFLIGGFQDTVDFNPDSLVSNNLIGPSIGYTSNIFVASYGSLNFNFIWARQFGGLNSFDIGTAISFDRFNNLLVTGTYSSNCDWDSSSSNFYLNPTDSNLNNVFILQLSTAGQFNWVKGFNSLSGLGYNYVVSPAIDSTGNIYLSGGFDGLTDFNPDIVNSNYITPQAIGNQAIFFVSLSPTGAYQWSSSISSPGNTYCLGQGINIAGNDLYACGNFASTVDFDIGPGTYPVTSNGGWGDAFVFKMNNYVLLNVNVVSKEKINVYPNPTTGIINIECKSGIAIDQILVYNQLGLLVECKKSLLNNTIFIDDSPGIYYLKIISKVDCVTIPVVKF